MKHKLSPILWIILGAGCSASASKGTRDGSMDLAGSIDSAALEVSPPRDAADARDGRDAVASSEAALPLDGSRGPDTSDSRDGTVVRDVPADQIDAKDGTAQDANQPTPDVAIDSPSTVLGTCASPIEIPYYSAHSELTVSTAGASHILNFPCAANGSDLVFKVQASQPELAYADTFGTPWNTALFFSDTCDKPNPPDGTGTAVCNDDACGTSQSQATALLGYGWHYLIVSGVNGEGGDVTVHFQHSPVGTGPLATLPLGSDVLQGTVSGSDPSRLCEAAGPKNSYWWASCPNSMGGNLHASTCNGPDLDTVLLFHIPQLDIITCNDEDPTCGQQSTIDTPLAPGAGLFVLTVASKLLSIKNTGDYILSYSRP
jgi:hypothetical protein